MGGTGLGGIGRRTLGTRGFTLLEVLVVMSIVLVVIGISALSISPGKLEKKLDWAAADVASSLRQARNAAIFKGESKAMVFDLDSGTYGPAEGRSRKVPAGLRMGIRDSVAGDIINGKYSMVFYSGGWIEGGDILIWDRKRTLLIKMDPVSGFAVKK